MENSQPTYPLDGIQIHSCQYCRKIVFDWNRCLREGFSPRGYVFSALETEMAALDGCELFRRERHRVRRAIAPASNPRLTISPFLDAGEAYLIFDWEDDDVNIDYGEAVDWKRMAFVTEESPVASLIQARPLNKYPGSPRTLEWAKAWLQRSLDHSAREGNPQQAGCMPTRLLYVGSKDAVVIPLTDSNDESPVSYAALSYCWGDPKANELRTTQATVASRYEGVSFRQLPRTLKDAVTTTRALGLEYLWVDSLCIIQDDEEDKNREIANMSRIYGKSTITISAARAERCTDGFLQERDLIACYEQVYELPFVGPDGTPTGQTVFCSERDLRRSERDPIDCRAWPLQEHRLPPRLVRFGTCQVVLTYREPENSYEEVRVDGGSDELSEQREEISTNALTGILIEWRSDVVQYTSRSITRPEDRLPAIAAIAENYGKRLGSGPQDYLAGLWRQGLPGLLLWYIPDDSIPRQSSRPLADTIDTSPSWSWQYAPVGVQYAKEINRSHKPGLLEILHCETSLATEVEYGRVANGRLVVKGPLVKVVYDGTPFMMDSPGDLARTASIEVKWDMMIEPLYGKLLYCLQVVDDGCGHYHGLVLDKFGDENFRRLGYFESEAGGHEFFRHVEHRVVTII